MNAKRFSMVCAVIGLLLVSGAPVFPAVAQREGPFYLPLIMNNQSTTPPRVNITYIHPCRQVGTISGSVQNVNPADYKIAVFIYTSGWWNKPYWDPSLTTINADSTWQANVTTGTGDEMATKFGAFLVSNGYNPPLLSGPNTLPQELWLAAAANDIETRDCPLRSITFSGYDWFVKAADGLTGPGPNYFSDDANDVFVDAQGYLHLNIVYRGGHWWCTEVINASHLGYGTYVFKIASPVNGLDPNVVLGLFTWDDTSAAYAHREIDLEFSTWAIPGNQNSQYVVQPYDVAGNITRFNTLSTGETTHGFTWHADSVFFQSLDGDTAFPGAGGAINAWTYTGGNLPVPANEAVRMNLWLFNGVAPAGPVEIIIKSFEFIP